jgi:hypothetical protein
MRKSLFTLVLTLLFTGFTFAQEPSNIVLVTVQNTAEPVIINVEQISDNAQYTNQPHFSADNNGLFYTQAFLSEKDNKAIQMDSMFYSLADKSTKNLTQSPNLSEYSPTPSLNGFSTILVDEAGKQWLWEHSQTNGKSGKLFNAEPVGYHVWESDETALAFVLGEPHTLQRLHKNSPSEVLDSSIGPSMWRIPNTNTFSYSKYRDDDSYWVMKLEKDGKSGEPLFQLPSDTTYYAWLPDGTAVAGADSLILRYVDGKWKEWLNLSEHCKKISRLHSAENIGSVYIAAVCVTQ